MIKGECAVYNINECHYSISCAAFDHRVMSGVITGPYFIQFFGNPSALAVGTMVAVLEVGAFGTVQHAYTHSEMLKRRSEQSRQSRPVALAIPSDGEVLSSPAQ